MEKTQRLLDIQRNAFDRVFEDIISELDLSQPDATSIKGNIFVLDNKIENINLLSKELIDMLLDSSDDSSEPKIIAEVMNSDLLNSKYNKLKITIDERFPKNSGDSICDSSKSSHSNTCFKTKLKLPRIELKKFGGNLNEWIPFWSQFKRIHEDPSIEKEDKFQYLVQSTISKSRARQLVESYPPSAENYDKVINSLKTRFGKDDLLIEFYVRELLKLVLSNLKVKTNLVTLFDRLESQLQSLETLGVTSEKYAAMLFPLVESCLPENLLRIWQRSQNNSELQLTPISESTDNRLIKLMTFLKKEVEDEEKICLATSCFDLKSKNEVKQNISIPTASGLINYQKVLKCVFCKGTHLSDDCIDANKMSLIEKKNILYIKYIKGHCHLCLKHGHIARRCRVRLECQQCKGKHVSLMCPNLSTGEKTVAEESHGINNSINVESLANNTYHQVFLQTIVVELKSDTCTRKVRCIIDTGSQRSYINKFVAADMNFEPLGTESIVHALFGGQSEIVNHSVYKIRLDNLNKRYACNFQVLDQPIICSNITSIHEGPWMQELKQLGIEIADTDDGPIDILIGADVVGKLFTGKKYNLKCGLTAIETLLGWTILGKVANSCLSISKSTSMMVTSLLCKNEQICNLWNLDVLGITDPIDKQTKEEAEIAVFQHFQNSVTVNNDGRYEVALPWIAGHPPIPNNFKLAKRRLDCLMIKLKNDGYYNEYDKSFFGMVI